MSIAFRHTDGFGKRIEYWVVGLMLKQGLDVYLPLVDDNAIDAVIKRLDGSFIELQIKARSSTVKLGDGGLFAAITHELRHNYWFVLYTERARRDLHPLQRGVHRGGRPEQDRRERRQAVPVVQRDAEEPHDGGTRGIHQGAIREVPVPGLLQTACRAARGKEDERWEKHYI